MVRHRADRSLAGQGHIDDEHVLLELGRAVEDRAVRANHQGAPIEHELVLASDEVEVDHRCSRRTSAPDDHCLALSGLALVERRGVDVEQDPGTGSGLNPRRVRREARCPRRSTPLPGFLLFPDSIGSWPTAK